MRVYRAALAAIAVAIMSTGGTYSDNSISQPSPAAFEEALIKNIIPQCNRQGLVNDSVEVGRLYCSMKQSGEIPWTPQLSSARDDNHQKQEYDRNMNNGISLAVKKWVLSHFGSEDAYGKWLQNVANNSPPQAGCASHEVAMKNIAAGEADRHLCPGWPGRPRPPN